MKFNIDKKRALFTSLVAKYKQIVLWGFRNSTHSHQYIHLGYFEFLNKMNIPCIWVDDVTESNDLVVPGALVMLPDIYLPNLKHTFRRDISYIFHQGKTVERPEILEENRVFLYEYRDYHLKQLSEAENPEIHAPAVAFFPAQSTVLQPWGTDLLASEFLDAATPTGHDVIFVGTAWGDKDGKINGNIKILQDIENRVSMKGLNFHRTQNVSSSKNIELVRASRLALCPSAINHAKNGYLQCRVFKNISYGQLAITDVPRFKDILGESFVSGDTWEDRIDAVLAMSPEVYHERVELQQYMIKDYTYLDMWTNMLILLDRQSN